MKKETEKDVERRAAKNHRCCNCACTIHKGHLYKHSSFYVPVSYDTEFETKSGGNTEQWRTHLSPSECDLAMRIEIGNLLN